MICVLCEHQVNGGPVLHRFRRQSNNIPPLHVHHRKTNKALRAHAVVYAYADNDDTQMFRRFRHLVNNW
jgi:hypothetical protein